MDRARALHATAAATSVAASLGLAVDETVVLHDSNRLTLRLLPCDVVARVSLVGQHVAPLELDLAQQLLAAGCPVAALEPRVEPLVHERDGFAVTLWTYYAPVAQPAFSAADHAHAFAQLHAGMRSVDVATPHVTDRIDHAQQLVASRGDTPALADANRELLAGTLRDLRRSIVRHRAADQLLHGEPHPGNVLTTSEGLLFVDLETCCRGPVELDLAHAPEEVAEHYPGVDQQLLAECRILVLALASTWRWDRDDRFPRGHELGLEWLDWIRAARGCDG